MIQTLEIYKTKKRPGGTQLCICIPSSLVTRTTGKRRQLRFGRFLSQAFDVSCQRTIFIQSTIIFGVLCNFVDIQTRINFASTHELWLENTSPNNICFDYFSLGIYEESEIRNELLKRAKPRNGDIYDASTFKFASLSIPSLIRYTCLPSAPLAEDPDRSSSSTDNSLRS